MRFTLSNRALWVLFAILLIICGLFIALDVHAVSAQSATSINAPADQPAAPLFSDFAVVVIVATILFIVGGALYLTARGVPPDQVDKWASVQIEHIRTNQALVNSLKDAYEKQSSAMRGAVDTLTSILQAVSPLLGRLQLDDATLALLKDIQQPPAASTITLQEDLPAGSTIHMDGNSSSTQ